MAYRRNKLLDIAVEAGAEPATEEHYKAEEPNTSLLFHLPAVPKPKLKKKKPKGKS